MSNLYINKVTKVIHKWYDLGGYWFAAGNPDYYVDILSDEDFKKEYKLFNALETTIVDYEQQKVKELITKIKKYEAKN